MNYEKAVFQSMGLSPGGNPISQRNAVDGDGEYSGCDKQYLYGWIFSRRFWF